MGVCASRPKVVQLVRVVSVYRLWLCAPPRFDSAARLSGRTRTHEKPRRKKKKVVRWTDDAPIQPGPRSNRCHNRTCRAK